MKRIDKVRAGIAAFAIVGGSVAVAVPVAADTGNTVNNCYGRYFTRDWEQSCRGSGATEAGTYRSVADCDNQPDKSLTVDREKGSRATVDGSDCNFSVRGVSTGYFG